MTVNGHGKDVLIDASGTVVEVEEEVALDKLPEEVKAGLEAKAKGKDWIRLSRSRRREKLVAIYEGKW